MNVTPSEKIRAELNIALTKVRVWYELNPGKALVYAAVVAGVAGLVLGLLL